MTDTAEIPILGYCDKLSARPGETLAFQVSSRLKENFDLRVVRSICADPNPDGPGLIEEDVPGFEASYPSRIQDFYPGSYFISDGAPFTGELPEKLTISVAIWPTLMTGKRQSILSSGNLSLFITPEGSVALEIGDQIVESTHKLGLRHWATISAALDFTTGGKLELSVKRLDDAAASSEASMPCEAVFDNSGKLIIAAKADGTHVTAHFNGKIESPSIHLEMASQSSEVIHPDFSYDISSTRIKNTQASDIHPADGTLINHPARAMTGSTWDGSEMNWQRAPEHYGAIHFHEDDIYDFGWETDFTIEIPDDMPSGIYTARISAGGQEDAIPFFVCPPKEKRSADACLLVSTFTYSVYGNHARPDFKPSWKDRFNAWNAYPHNPAEHREYGLSTYNYHSDGSGICHASHKRPLFNMRPGYVTFGYGTGSGHRHFQADSHLVAWLHEKNYDFDVITDMELHNEGAEALEGYKVLITGSHPEYHTANTWDAIKTYRDTGGRLIYLGGNGFYWRVALHQEDPTTIEIRRAEAGIRAWAAEPGEYYHAFDGHYGGLWRRNARPPQSIVGVGFSAQGQFEGSYYRRKAEAGNPDTDWAFAGIEDDVLGDFGLSGGGAAGFELDRADTRLGTPDNFHLLASSENHQESFVLVPEEHLTHITNIPGEPVDDLIRADMIYFEVPGGGEVFSTGSITFCGSLPHNHFNNNISTLLANVINRFLR